MNKSYLIKLGLVFVCCVSFSNLCWAQQYTLSDVDVREMVTKLYNVNCANNTEKPNVVISANIGGGFARVTTFKNSPRIEFSRAFYEFVAKNSFIGKEKAALAFVLGHELTHWEMRQNKGFFPSELQSAIDVNSPLSEDWADVQGAFLAYLAGYDTREIVPLLIQKIYTVYKIDPNCPNYPNAPERQKAAKRAIEKVSRLIQIYEAANYMLVLGQEEMAGYAYQAILDDGYQGAEIYNNLGVCYTMQALSIARKYNQKYYYPIQIDFNTRLNKGFEEQMTIDEQLEFRRLLEKAKGYFEKIETICNTSIEVKLNVINLYCIWALGEEKHYKTALDQLTGVEKNKLNTDQQATVKILKAIIFAETNKVKEANDILSKETSSVIVNKIKNAINGTKDDNEQIRTELKYEGMKLSDFENLKLENIILEGSKNNTKYWLDILEKSNNRFVFRVFLEKNEEKKLFIIGSENKFENNIFLGDKTISNIIYTSKGYYLTCTDGILCVSPSMQIKEVISFYNRSY